MKKGDLVVKGIVYNLCIDENNLPPPSSSSLSSSSSSTTSGSISASCEQGQDPSLLQPVFAEGVQGRVNFECKGPRLNKTKIERLSVVYAQDYRLHWRVVGPMPRLLVRATDPFLEAV